MNEIEIGIQPTPNSFANSLRQGTAYDMLSITAIVTFGNG